MNPVQYIILNKGANMSTGKAAAQAAHASQMGLLSMVGMNYSKSPYDTSLGRRWMMGGHMAKVVLEVADEDALLKASEYIGARGFDHFTVIDEGRTEIAPMTRTAIGTEVVDKDQGHVRATFGEFKLYTDPRFEPSMIINYTDHDDDDGMELEGEWPYTILNRWRERRRKEKGDAR